MSSVCCCCAIQRSRFIRFVDSVLGHLCARVLLPTVDKFPIWNTMCSENIGTEKGNLVNAHRYQRVSVDSANKWKIYRQRSHTYINQRKTNQLAFANDDNIVLYNREFDAITFLALICEWLFIESNDAVNAKSRARENSENWTCEFNSYNRKVRQLHFHY